MEQVEGRHQHAWGAEAALQAMTIAEGTLERVRLSVICGEAFDRSDRASVRLHGEHEAGPRRLTIHHDGARTAHAVLAPQVSTRESEVLTEGICQCSSRIDVDDGVGAVDCHVDLHQ